MNVYTKAFQKLISAIETNAEIFTSDKNRMHLDHGTHKTTQAVKFVRTLETRVNCPYKCTELKVTFSSDQLGPKQPF